ncbi:MAG: hypothetical protein KAI79_10400 [Bacteroidales bacterium]|nr:hypothetical protein [Bacteroidales bacterium]
MIDKSIFSGLQQTGGYMGAVLSDYTGEVLVSDTDKVKKLDETSMRFNEDFRNIHDVTDGLGLGHTKSMDVKAENATIIMACSGTDSRVHLHAFVILKPDGSVALARLALDEVIVKAVKELAN